MVTMQFGPYVAGIAVVGFASKVTRLAELQYTLVCVWCHNSSFYGITSWRV